MRPEGKLAAEAFLRHAGDVDRMAGADGGWVLTQGGDESPEIAARHAGPGETEEQVDLIIFNASLHYSTRYETTLAEALRVLRPNGQLIILDSPLYRSADSGAQMVREREAAFTQAYGFPSNALLSENYLTEQRLKELAETLKVSPQKRWPRSVTAKPRKDWSEPSWTWTSTSAPRLARPSVN